MLEAERKLDGELRAQQEQLSLALAAAKPGQYDLILMDIQMPMMNGYEAAKQIRAMKAPFCRQIPVIAMTVNAFEEDKALALQAGMNDYLAKPIQIDKMRKVISGVLRDGQI